MKKLTESQIVDKLRNLADQFEKAEIEKDQLLKTISTELNNNGISIGSVEEPQLGDDIANPKDLDINDAETFEYMSIDDLEDDESSEEDEKELDIDDEDVELISDKFDALLDNYQKNVSEGFEPAEAKPGVVLYRDDFSNENIFDEIITVIFPEEDFTEIDTITIYIDHAKLDEDASVGMGSAAYVDASVNTTPSNQSQAIFVPAYVGYKKKKKKKKSKK